MPTDYKFTDEEAKEIIFDGPAMVDLGFLSFPLPTFGRRYRKAIFEDDTREFWKNMNVVGVWGDETINQCLATLWNMEKDSEARRGKLVKFEMIPGANHFVSDSADYLEE